VSLIKDIEDKTEIIELMKGKKLISMKPQDILSFCVKGGDTCVRDI